MTDESTALPPRNFKLLLWRVFRRIVITAAGFMLIGWAMHAGLNALERHGGPAGFGRGMLQGAMMPGTMPVILLGQDPVIYSVNNTGISYKLGYTAGVNACGVLFFGYFFWRLKRWRKRIQSIR